MGALSNYSCIVLYTLRSMLYMVVHPMALNSMVLYYNFFYGFVVVKESQTEQHSLMAKAFYYLFNL